MIDCTAGATAIINTDDVASAIQAKPNTVQPAVHIPDLRQALAFDDPDERSHRALRALNWDQPASRVEWLSTTEGYGRFYLGPFPTAASVATPQGTHTEDPWRKSWLGGFRWCLVLGHSEMSWFDLQQGVTWKRSADALRLDEVSGLTPESFSRIGRLEPRGTSFERPEKELPENPTVYLLARLERWWRLYMDDLDGPSGVDSQKSEFTRIISALLLLRTIEDLGKVPWLKYGTLRRASDDLGAIFQCAASNLNSRVLHDIASLHIPSGFMELVVKESYDLNIDFGALDVDPVGAFYERILGVQYTSTPIPQQSLFQRAHDVVVDRSARRQQGVYYTPRAYADTLAHTLVRPEARAATATENLPIIADLAAGSGELLCAALRQVLSVAAWRKPSIAREILDRKLFAIDSSESALNLCALNILRTAIREVPEILTDNIKLPTLRTNLVHGNALSLTTLQRVPQAHIILINPPFHGPRHWSANEIKNPIRELRTSSRGAPNQAIAFLAAAIRKLEPGGGLGAVLPTQLMSGLQGRHWRRWLAERLNVEFLLANDANPFGDAQSYAGLLVARRRSGSRTWRPRTYVIHINGAVQMSATDIGALLADGGTENACVKSRLVSPIDEKQDNWLETISPPRISSPRSGRITLSELLGDKKPVHQAIVPAPRPWGRDLFLFRELDSGKLSHLQSDLIIPNSSTRFRRVASPNLIGQGAPLLGEPVAPKLYGFLPDPDGKLDRNSEFSASDPTGFLAAQQIRAVVLATSHEAQTAPEAREYRENLRRRNEVYFATPKGYRDTGDPLVLISRASRSSVGIAAGIGLSTWVNFDGLVLPFGGMYFRAPTEEIAASLALFLLMPECTVEMRARASPRNMGTGQVTQSSIASWQVPDLTSDSLQPTLAELFEAFVAYRATGEDPKSQAASSQVLFQELIRIAIGLWDHGI